MKTSFYQILKKPSMKYINVFALVFITMISCSSSKTLTSKAVSSNTMNATETIHITNNEGFNITFKDKGFYAWLQKQQPKKEFLESTLEINNYQYVEEWNKRASNPSMYDPKLYSQIIPYKFQPKKRYGLDVNYELFMYFKFFEEKHEKILLKL